MDAICIATPVPLHPRQAIAALEAGKHVLSEVTAGYTLEEGWDLIAAVDRTSLTYMNGKFLHIAQMQHARTPPLMTAFLSLELQFSSRREPKALTSGSAGPSKGHCHSQQDAQQRTRSIESTWDHD